MSNYRSSIINSSSSPPTQPPLPFWKPGSITPGTFTDRNDYNDTLLLPPSSLSLLQLKASLPIYQHKRTFLYVLTAFQTIVIVGQTGSGKTTQLPQYLYENKYVTKQAKMIVTQPKRIAARAIAERVAMEMGVGVGEEVGYSIKLEKKTSDHSVIVFMTDGMLIREIMNNPLLIGYNYIMIDEAHERSLYTDIILGLIKKIAKKREDLKIIISSATLDAITFKNFYETNKTTDNNLDTATVLTVDGRQFPVDMYYLDKPCSNYVTECINIALKLHENEDYGDILIFVTGQDEVIEICTRISDLAQVSRKGYRLNILPLYSELAHEESIKVFDIENDKRVRRIIVSTNIAETSVTIPNIVYVIDSGFAKLKSYDPRSGMEVLVVTPISHSSANQRAGRAGRVKPGKCYRLFTEDHFYRLMPLQTVPEMQRSNLAWVILQLKAMGIDNVVQFDFLSAPPTESMIRGLELLYSLGALDDYCKLTKPIGETLAELPIEPRLAKMLIAAGELGCSEQILSIAAMLSVQSVFITPKAMKNLADSAKKKFAVMEGDHITLLNVYDNYIANSKNQQWCHENYVNHRALNRAIDIRKQLKSYCSQFHIPLIEATGDDTLNLVRKAIVCGFFSNAAQLQPDNTYKSVRGNQELIIHPSSVLSTHAPSWVIYHDIVLTTKKYMRDITVIDPTWLSELAPHFYEYKSNYQKATADIPVIKGSVSKSMESSISSLFGGDSTVAAPKKDSGHFNLFAIPDDKPKTKPKPGIDFNRSYFDFEDESSFPPKSKQSKFNR